MRTVCRSLLIALTISALQCKLPTAADDPDAISSLRFTPSAFDSFRRNTELRYSLKSASSVSIYIIRRDSAGGDLLVRTLVETLNETKGSHSITWIGDTDQRLFAPAGIYFGIVQLQEHRFETIVQVFHL